MEREKKTIVIEAQRIFRKNKHGMDMVVLEMIRSLQKLDTYNTYVVAVGPGEDRCLEETSNFRIVTLPSSNYLVWEQLLLPRLLRQTKADLLHCTSNTAPLGCRVALVLTLHDIIFMEKAVGDNKSFYQKLGRIYRRFFVPFILKSVDRVITVSHFEEDNIRRHYAQLSDKIVTVYNGVSPNFRPVEQFTVECLKDIEKGRYWFLLGNTDPKKNIRNTLKAYSYYLQQSTVKRVLLIADLTAIYLDSILEELQISHIREHIVVKKYIAHDILVEVYGKAFAFLYPSIRESFGLPLLESMACGTPVVASNSSAIPEIAGDHVVYVDPLDPRSIADGMLSLEDNPVLYNGKVAAGLQRSQDFTWEATAAQTMAIYTDTLARYHGN